MIEALTQEIEDLCLFADPFENFNPNLMDKERWVAQLIRKGKNIRAVREQDGAITIHSDGRLSKRHKDFRALLVDDMFADLERLATAQRHQVRESVYDNTSGMPKNFINSRVTIRVNDENRGSFSFDGVSRFLNEQDQEMNLRVIIIDGIAGVGKTLLIKRVVAQRSRPSSYKSGNPLLLHVESLGKVLTALNDRIAGTLSNLRASFVEAELKPLIRRGLIQLAIDGFDELSDSRGYSRAWGALQDFLRDLNGKGTCILAGRDTMLNEETVKDGLGPVIGSSKIIFLSLHEPQPEDIKNWLIRNPNWRNENEALEQIQNQAKSIEYIRRPFLISLISETIGPKEFEKSGGEPIVDLMNKMILRESRKLVPNNESIGSEMVASLYTDVLSEAARMMMDDETDSIEIDLLKLITEEVFTGNLSSETVEAIRNRADTLAMLEQRSGEEERRVFSHETIKSYFFAKSVIRYLPDFGPMNALYRNPLNTEDFRIFNRVIRNEEPQQQRTLRKKLLEMLREENQMSATSNLVGLVLSFLPLESDDIDATGDESLVLTHKKLQNVWMGEHIGIQQAQLYDCQIGKLDVRGADLSGIQFFDVEVQELFVDRFVKFGKTTPDEVRSLTLDPRHRPIGTTEHRQTLFNPTEIREWMSSHQNPEKYTIPSMSDEYYLLEKLARISMRQYWLRSTDHEAKKLVRSEHWGSLCELLEAHDRLKVRDNVPASGSSSLWFHLVEGHEFLDVVEGRDNVSTSTRKILQALRCE